MDIKIGKICKIGGRQKNDDTAEIALGNNAVRAYIGDGLGSYAGGKQASETAGNVLMTFRGSMLGEEALRTAAQQANQAVYSLQSNTQGTMKTTMVFLDIEDDKARWMHIGDSRLYHFVNGKQVFQTTDHSVSQMAVMMGEINTHQIRFHEDRNRVLRSLGGENAKPEISEVVDVSDGFHAFLLCTDGFWEYVYEPEMESTLAQASSPEEWIALMEQILQSRITGSNDNYSASVVFLNSEAWTRLPAHRRGQSKRGKGFIFPLALALTAAAAVGGLLFVRQPKPVDAPPTTTPTVLAPSDLMDFLETLDVNELTEPTMTQPEESTNPKTEMPVPVTLPAETPTEVTEESGSAS